MLFISNRVGLIPQLRALPAAWAVLLLFGCVAQASQPIRLKTASIDPGTTARPVVGRHFIVQFSQFPAAETQAELERRGVRVLAYVPDFALMVSADSTPDLHGLDVTWIGSPTASDKISPDLAGPGDAFLVMMQPDIPLPTARRLLRSHGYFIVDTPGLLPGDFVVIGPYSAIYDLAASDDVAYIMPPSPELLSGQPVLACGGPITAAGPVAQYAQAGSGWTPDATGSVTLTYSFEALSTQIDTGAQQSEITRALEEWASYANVGFVAGTNPTASRNVDIKFASGAHGDDYPFLSGSVMAHAFYPVPFNPEPIAGNIHFNAAENWQIGADTDVFSVALHEAGHALGLGHSDQPEAVMYPYYHMVTGLSASDIATIQVLYGSKSPASQIPVTQQPSPTPVSTPAPAPSPAPSPSPEPTPTPAAPDDAPPSLNITSPGMSIVTTDSSSITISGTASDNVGVSSVNWSTSTGSTGTATGTTNWSAVVPLLEGNNTVTITAYDAAGNSAWRALTVVLE
jgi:Matrixin/Glucodextranase, domain B